MINFLDLKNLVATIARAGLNSSHLRLDQLIILVPLTLWPSLTLADYRAYELRIRHIETGKEKLITSTLDHIQYPGYYPLNANEVVEYVRSWRCWGRTGNFKPLCPAPTDESAPLATPTTPKL